MRLFIIIMFLSLIYAVSSKNNVKTLTESMGQEVIEIGTPIKELPMGIEEEPSAEVDDDDEKPTKMTTNTVQPVTKKDSKKTTTVSDFRKNVKDIEKIDVVGDEEARIEKELAEIYKDTADYKSDSADDKEVAKEIPKELPKELTNEPSNNTEEAPSGDDTDKPIGRERTNFKFQPDTTDKEDVERFRTSVDEISCNNRQKLSGTPAPVPNQSNAFNIINHGVAIITGLLCYTFICN